MISWAWSGAWYKRWDVVGFVLYYQSFSDIQEMRLERAMHGAGLHL
jgi:hypothetical protein